jgi:predicted AlkP superfamily phosphohydrolase/phosphomutase
MERLLTGFDPISKQCIASMRAGSDPQSFGMIAGKQGRKSFH